MPPHAFETQAGRRDVAGDTHWDRILHCDVMARSTVDPALRVAGPPPREASGSGQMRSPLTQAAILLCIYVGMYLAVGVVIDAVSWFTADHVPAASATSASVAPLPIEASK